MTHCPVVPCRVTSCREDKKVESILEVRQRGTARMANATYCEPKGHCPAEKLRIRKCFDVIHRIGEVDMYVATLDMLFCSSYDEVIIVVYTQISNYSAFVFCHIPVNKRQLFSMLPRLY